MFDLVKTIVTEGAGRDAYAKRAKMLLEIFQCVHLKSGVRQVNEMSLRKDMKEPQVDNP